MNDTPIGLQFLPREAVPSNEQGAGFYSLLFVILADE